MSKKINPIVELILAAIFVVVGIFAVIKIEAIIDYIFWILISFFVIKVLLTVIRQSINKTSKVFIIVQAVLSAAAIIYIILFRDNIELLSYVIVASAVIDIVTNIVKTFEFRKKQDVDAFFGMDNVINILFIILIFANRNSPTIATGVIFGSLVMYEGVSTIVSNSLVRSIVSMSDFGKAINKVRGLDIFFGLIIVIMIASFMLPYLEPGINTIGDAWWYCFALITTIGFGDFTAVTLVGRIISVIIGFYGIIIVSLLTSSIVVYITDSNKKKK